MPRRFGLLAVLFAFILSPALADEVTSFKLENGMEVVVIEDHRAPVVVHMVWYKVGAADEPAGKSGIAHFLEHLMFKGTNAFPGSTFSDTVEANGGSDNAFTSWDYTGYFQRVAADRLPLMMEMEADRMTGLRLTEEDVATERDVIVEERNQRTENSAGALFNEQTRAAQYLNHPYGIPIVGWMHEITALGKEDALSFYNRFYAPNNAVLVVAGDVDPIEVRALAEQYYGVLTPSNTLPEQRRPSEPPQLAERRLSYADARVAQPYVLRTYLAPERNPGDQKDAAALVFLAELLGGEGATSVLGNELQFKNNIAVYTSAFYSGMSVDESTFGFVVVPAPDVELGEAEQELDRVLAAFMENGPDLETFESLKMQQRASDVYARDNIQGLAQRYGSALAAGLSVEDVQNWPAILQAVTVDDVMAAAENLLDRRRAVTGWLTRPAQEVTQ